MLLQNAIELAQEMIATRCQNPHYDRVCKLARQYKALMTGENAEILLTQFIRREDDEAFKQRLALTIMITPAVISALMNPFNKVSWNKKVKKSYDFKTPQRNDTVAQMRESFYGRKKSKNKGLDYWLKTRFPAFSFVDPNAWLVIEWDAPLTKAEVIKPRPFEVTSEMAWHWSVVNEETKWLWVHQDIVFNKLVKVTGQNQNNRIAAGISTPTNGDKWTLYDEENTLVYTEVDPEYLKSTSYVKEKNEKYWKDPVTKKTFSVKTYQPNLSFAPAFRVGYMKDPETDGCTFVNGWHTAMPYLMKSVKAVSEMDLTMALHTFPQKMQYVQKCPGLPAGELKKRQCNGGVDAAGGVCGACKGVGYKVHTSAQDALFFPFPEPGTTNSELLDLDKLLVYKGPPIDLLAFQDKYIESLKTSCYAAVFNQTQMTKANSSGDAGNGPVTATETNVNSQGVNQALHPFTEKVSDTWIEIMFTFGILASTPLTEEVDISCIFPINPNMKSVDELLSDLKTANDSGAPPFLKDSINNDIAEILYEGDNLAEKKYTTKHQFFPFNGQTADEIAMNMASQYVSTFTKVLYSNFEAIFSDIDLDNVGFWFKDYAEQWPIVEAMVKAYQAEIETNMMPDLSLGTPGDGNPNPEGSPDAKPKPGEPGYVEETPA